MSSRLWERINYRSDIHFVLDNCIREYDITKANISVLRDANILSESQYDYLLHCPKLEREVIIGKMQGSNPEITKILKAGIANARKVFMESNGIQDSEILAIRNDSITIFGNRPIINLDISERVKFRESGVYTSFFHINAIDLYYFYDRVAQVERLDVKGLGDSGVSVHKDYMLDFITELLYCAQVDGVKYAIQLLQKVYSNYIERSLSIGYYRELNPGSKYKMHSSFSLYDQIYADNLTEYDKRYIDISYNENVLRELNKMLASIYFSTK